MKELINKIIDLWKTISDADFDGKKIRLGVNYDWTLHQALEYVEKDSTGLIACLKLKQAYKEFLNANVFTLSEILNGEFDKVKDKLLELNSYFYNSELSDIYFNFLTTISKNIEILGKHFSVNDIDKVEKIEDILTKAVLNFDNKYELRHEKFTDGNLKKCNANILPKLFRFKTFEQFVSDLKTAHYNNFICVALIDRTYNEIQDEDYDNNYDSFFAVGVKNNNVVITISDRVIFNSPETIFKTRNPSRKFENKLDYSYLPYSNIDEIKEICDNDTLKITYDNKYHTNKDNLVDLFNDEALIYIITLLMLANDKYFKNVEDKELERNFFGSEIKLLEPSKCKEIAVIDEQLYLPEVSNNVRYDSYMDKDENIFNSGIFDHFIDEYPLTDNIEKLPTTFIGTEDQAQKRLWWQVRKAQAKHIQEELNKSYNEKYKDIENWFVDMFKNNAENIFNYMINTDDYNYLSTIEKTALSDIYKNHSDIQLSSLKTDNNDCIEAYGRSSGSFENILGKVNYQFYYNYLPVFYIENDNTHRSMMLTLTIRNWTDLKEFFNIDNLPKELKYYFNMRSENGYGKYAWEPYSGNKILDYTDPMNDIQDPFSQNLNYHITLIVSKSMYNKIKKLRKSK